MLIASPKTSMRGFSRTQSREIKAAFARNGRKSAPATPPCSRMEWHPSAATGSIMSLFSRSRVLSKAICVEYQVENGGLHIRTLGTRAALSTGCCAVPSDTGCPLSSSLACSVSSPAIGTEAQGFGRRLMPSQSLVAALGDWVHSDSLILNIIQRHHFPKSQAAESCQF